MKIVMYDQKEWEKGNPDLLMKFLELENVTTHLYGTTNDTMIPLVVEYLIQSDLYSRFYESENSEFDDKYNYRYDEWDLAN